MIIMDHRISILMRQTNYTKEECTELLKTYSLEECIIQYLQIKKKEEPKKTTNQAIFKTIRDFF
jgi:hypothetical protein